MKRFFQIICCALFTSVSVFAQDGINYQGAATDANGDELTNQTISLRASIISGSANGNLEWEETHSTTTDQFGLFNVVIGQGNATTNVATANFDDIDWGSGNHFLKIEMDASGGTNYSLIGTTQMMSVPYALYAKSAGNSTNMSVSNFGDTLTINGQSVIIPGISYDNAPSSMFGSVTDINLNTYQTVIIGNQEWMMENLKVTNYSNGDAIVLQSSTSTNNTICNTPSYKQHNNGETYYNGHAVLDNRNICPTGWHVPTKAEFEILLDFFGENIQTNPNNGPDWTSGGSLKSKSSSESPHFIWSDYLNNTNESHLNILPTQMMYCGSNNLYYPDESHLYTVDQQNGSQYYMVVRGSNNIVNFYGHSGYPSTYFSCVRCIKD